MLAVRKRAHLDGPAIADGVNVRKVYVMPFAAVLGADMGMNENYNPAADRKKLLWFTGSFGQPCSGLREIALHTGAPMVSTSSGKVVWFTPLDVGIEWLQCSIDSEGLLIPASFWPQRTAPGHKLAARIRFRIDGRFFISTVKGESPNLKFA